MRKHLTELSVRALKPIAGKQVKVWDTSTRGFGIRINGSSKSWIVMHGKARNLKVLGRYPDMNLGDARLAAKKVLIAPAAPRASLSFDEVLSRFLNENYVGKAERTKSEAKRLLDKYLLPTLARKKMSDVTDVHIGDCLDAIAAPSERLHT